ncbi:MAG TPA: zinc ribbon domain-containing protein [Thermoanaerobaculia bacterium]
MSRVACLACRHEIDSAAKICPYCGSDPTTGQKVVDTNALLQEIFRPRHVSASESVLEYARHRQGVVIAISGVLLFLILAALHQYVTMRNERLVSATSAVPLTEIADLSNQPEETKPLPMPELNFQYAGNPQAMRTFIVEPGAVAPPQPQPAAPPQPQ